VNLNRSCVVVGVVVFMVACATSVALGPPPPSVHDELSYLLAADTFARGRLTNPTHPQWQHFESFHTLQRPSYASKYFPAPGLALALGQVVAGHPIVGTWLTLAAAGAAVCWMLGAWLSPGWSGLGALLLVLRPQIALGWGDSYWGGGVPLLGGALVLGAVARLLPPAQVRVVDGLALAAGLLLVANSRPFEGCWVAACCLAILTYRWARHRPRPAARTLLPAAVLLASGAVFMGYYDFRVTGSPWRLPYVEYEQQYSYVPVFMWQQLKPPPAYRHEVFRRFYGYGAQIFEDSSAAATRASFELQQLRNSVLAPFLGYVLLLPLVASFWPRPRSALAMASLVAGLGALACEPAILPHYFAPALGALGTLVALGLHRLSGLRVRGTRVGAALVGLLVTAAVIEMAPGYATAIRRAVAVRHSWAATRVQIEGSLARLPGKHLVVVRYAPTHNFHKEWVYNRAAIDDAPVVWAREMDEAHNQALFEYFRDRHIWLLMADEAPIEVRPYGRSVAARSGLFGDDVRARRVPQVAADDLLNDDRRVFFLDDVGIDVVVPQVDGAAEVLG
jgi:hypothetical protein